MRDRGIQRHEYSHRYKLEALTVGVCIVRVMSGVGCLPRAGPPKDSRQHSPFGGTDVAHIEE